MIWLNLTIKVEASKPMDNVFQFENE